MPTSAPSAVASALESLVRHEVVVEGARARHSERLDGDSRRRCQQVDGALERVGHAPTLRIADEHRVAENRDAECGAARASFQLREPPVEHPREVEDHPGPAEPGVEQGAGPERDNGRHSACEAGEEGDPPSGDDPRHEGSGHRGAAAI